MFMPTTIEGLPAASKILIDINTLAFYSRYNFLCGIGPNEPYSR